MSLRSISASPDGWLHGPHLVIATAIILLVLGYALVAFGRWVERKLAEAEFRQAQRAWRDVAEQVGCGPYRPPVRLRGRHRRAARSGRHRQL